MIGLVAAMLLQVDSASASRPVELPDWLAGAWVTAPKSGDWSEEWWSTPRAGIMLGASRAGSGDKLEFFEHMRIERKTAGVQFCALPQGKAGACFPAVTSTPGEIVFENTAHDYPTRIIYRREEGGISAEISGPGGTRRQSWRFVPLTD